VSNSATQELIDECNRQFENCRDTAVSFTIWLRTLRWTRTFCLVAPVIFGALATWQVLTGSFPILTAVLTFLTTVIPPAYKASGIEASIQDYQALAGEFTNLRDRFRQAALISSKKSFAEFEADTTPLIERLEKARSRTLTPPDWYFKLARRKIEAGDYTHDYDEKRSGAQS
jgi:hypothetical protein